MRPYGDHYVNLFQIPYPHMILVGNAQCSDDRNNPEHRPTIPSLVLFTIVSAIYNRETHS